MLVKLGEIRIDPDTVVRYEQGYYVSGLDASNGNSYIYADGTDITFKDGKTRTFRIPITEVDAVLLGRT